MQKPSRKVIILAAVGTIVLVGLVAGIVVWQVVDWGSDNDTEEEYILPPSHSELGMYESAAVSTDAPYCSVIGRDIFLKNGSVADAAIATCLCVGLIQSQSMGLGGGFLMVHYEAKTKKTSTLNARERAPGMATRDMYEGKDKAASSQGPLAVAVPGELKGYWELHQKFGSLKWKELFEPTIQLAENGFKVTAHAANALRSHSASIINSTTLREVFFNEETQDVYKAGETMKRPVLAKTLRTIANAVEEGLTGDLLYQDHELMKKFVADLQNEEGKYGQSIITEADMLGYTATWDDPIEMEIKDGFKVHSTPPPASGLLLAFCLKIMSGFTTPLAAQAVDTYQRLVESFKHAFAKRTILGDPGPDTTDPGVVEEIEELRANLTSAKYINDILPLIHDDSTSEDIEYYGAEYYQPDNHGTAHVSILAPNGDAIAVTSTINLYFGARVRSLQTGIIYNDEMNDFSAPNITNEFGVQPSKNNFIQPRKRPVSSMTPAIFTDSQGKVRLVVGGSGGTKITTAVASVALRNIWFGENIKQAIDARRLHHQLLPMQLEYEDGFNMKIIDGLGQIGHKLVKFDVGTSMIQGIAVAENGSIFANADFRKEGTIAGY